MTGFDEATLRFYAKEAPDYAQVDWAGAGHLLRTFLKLVQPGAHVLELGCGAGRDTATMLAQGFDVEPTDGVPEMAREAEARTGRPVRVMRFDELDAVELYDAVWAHASLLHVPRGELPAILARVLAALKPGGFHFANYKTGSAEGRDSFGRYYSYPSAAELVEIYQRVGGWEMVSLEEGMGSSYDGTPAAWAAITVRKLP